MSKPSFCSITRWTAVLLIAFTIPSCKKSNSSGSSNGSYYMRFTLNGAKVEYDSQPIATIAFNNSNSLHTAVLAAYKDVNAGLMNAMTITIMSNAPFAAGISYNDPAKAREANGDTVAQTTILYYDPMSVGYLTLGSLADA